MGLVMIRSREKWRREVGGGHVASVPKGGGGEIANVTTEDDTTCGGAGGEEVGQEGLVSALQPQNEAIAESRSVERGKEAGRMGKQESG